MDKPNTLYPHNVQLFDHKKEWSTDICQNLNAPWKYSTKWKTPVSKGDILDYFIYVYNILCYCI